MRTKLITGLLVLVLLLVLNIPAWAGIVNVTANPDRIDMGINFSGQQISISGTAPAGSDIYVKLVSPTTDVKLNKKGKIGFLWMNTTTATVQNIPAMYLVYSSAPLERLSPALQEKMGIAPEFRMVGDRAIILEATGNQTHVLKGLQGKDYLDALFRMYEKNGLYGIKENVIQQEGEKFNLVIMLPGSSVPGNSLITAYAVKNGRILGSSSVTLNIRPVGMVRWERNTARNNALLYGVCAVLIAIVAGFVINFLFRFLEKSLASVANRLGGKLTTEKREISTEIH
ncbi:Putative transmembrane protein (Alph_Pro_TM) [Desulfofundulus australicus DSM 11792]|uniref:Putative transmembrane protein (Alph_Pro_TM) n=1 Tax=Desulfofundulus australicus DSM 11792 TaxID=1121425 RepID=A0A1M5BW88_9FIRM|nr:TIGR02186 family protein [Desulfofundulus australicus]SHF46695.1 Putative transmembrane protein (Alph_Pro_TM) [Desulfofundulus australicus DSM 11792]